MAEVAAAPAAAAAVPIPAPSERITHVVGDYVAGLWYGEPPAALPPATSYVLPFERKAGAQQHASELDRAKQDRAEQDIAEAKSACERDDPSTLVCLFLTIMFNRAWWCDWLHQGHNDVGLFSCSQHWC